MLCMALSALRLLHFAVYGLLSFFMGISVCFISHMVWPSYQAILSIIYTAPMILIQPQLVVTLMTGSYWC